MSMYYFVYILLSLKDRKFYVGFTTNLRLRLKEHNNGEVKSTRHRRPLKLIYFETYINELNARRRELFYKTGRGREILNKILKETLDEFKN